MPQLRDLLNVQPVPSHTPTPAAIPGSATGTGWQGWIDAADAAAKMIKGFLVGAPERVLDTTKNWVDEVQLGDSEGMSLRLPVPGERLMGGVDAVAAALPIIGKGGRLAEEAAEPFFSALRRSITERAPETGLAEHFLNVARKGGKAEELEWTGLEDYLKSMSGQRISKADVLKHLDVNAPELRERMIGEKFGLDGDNEIPAAKFTQYALPGGENHRELVITMPNAAEEPDEAFNKWLGAQYVNDVTDNFSHIDEMADSFLHTLPGETPLNRDLFGLLPEEVRAEMRDNFNADHNLGYAPTQLYNVPSGHAYGDPELDVNRLLHARFNDRTTTEGEQALHMEELQSDWHQSAREARIDEINRLMTSSDSSSGLTEEEARKQVPTDFGYAKHIKSLPKGYEIKPYLGSRNDPGDFDRWQANMRENGIDIPVTEEERRREWLSDLDDGAWIPMEEAIPADFAVYNTEGRATHFGGTRQEALNEFLNQKNGVPDAPFKTTWHELGFRRALDEAAAGPYDRLTWTTGKQQADRYSLAKAVDRLRYDPATSELTAYKGRGVGPAWSERVPQDKLHKYIGREAAEKLMATKKPGYWKIKPDATPGYPYALYDENGGLRGHFKTADEAAKQLEETPPIHELSGQDLEVGGEGMRGFYDEMLPSYANKLGKKYGVRAEKVEVPIAGKYMEEGELIDAEHLQDMVNRQREFLHSNELEITNEMSHDELQHELKNYMQGFSQSDIEYLSTKSDDIIRGALLGSKKTAIDKLKNSDILKDLVDADLIKPATQEVWSLPITDEMRADLRGRGQPLFAGTPVPPVIRQEDSRPRSRFDDLRMMTSRGRGPALH